MTDSGGEIKMQYYIYSEHRFSKLKQKKAKKIGLKQNKTKNKKKKIKKNKEQWTC